MFFMHMPLTFREGDRAPVRINGADATLWWRDAETLVINETDPRRICSHYPAGELQAFVCTDADGSAYVATKLDDGAVHITPQDE